ncbi:hypothetical protein ES708_12040 [subsurface metagenome]
MRIAVIGSEGMLGRDLVGFLGNRHEVVGLDIGEIDIRRREATVATIAEVQPHLIVNSAACVDVESCETEPERAWRVNALGAQNLAMAADRIGADYLYISSDYVFDGRSGGDYDEFATPCPVNQYGRSEKVEELTSARLSRQAERPCRTVLDCRLFELVTGHTMAHWQDGVRDYFINRHATKQTRRR